MATEDAAHHANPGWFVAPGETDTLAFGVLVLVVLAIYGIVTLYAAFDRWAEHKSAGTPLAKTIPTLLVIALLYEIFPLSHFNVLLPIAAILIALMADWARFNAPLPTRADEPDIKAAPKPVPAEPEESGRA